MRRRLNFTMCLICILTFVAGCTDNGDDTPVEVKVEEDVEQLSSVENSNKI